MKYLAPMLPTLAFHIPTGEDWYYEVKYDGFRCQCHWNGQHIQLYSRNGNNLNTQFPEIVGLTEHLKRNFEKNPFILDGELCCLENDLKGNFEAIQLRGKVKQPERIKKLVVNHPVNFLAFDLLMSNEKLLVEETYIERKHKLFLILEKLNLHTIMPVKQYKNSSKLFQDIKSSGGEGLIAKLENSLWYPGKRTSHWLKIKNYNKAPFIIIGIDISNGYFIAAVLKGSEIVEVGTFIHGMTSEQQKALRQIIENNVTNVLGSKRYIKPGISVTLQFLGIYKGSLREPRFVSFRLNEKWEDCTWENLLSNIQA